MTYDPNRDCAECGANSPHSLVCGECDAALRGWNAAIDAAMAAAEEYRLKCASNVSAAVETGHALVAQAWTEQGLSAMQVKRKIDLLRRVSAKATQQKECVGDDGASDQGQRPTEAKALVIGSLFRMARVARGLSLRETADHLGISHVELGEYERDKREPHDWHHIFSSLGKEPQRSAEASKRHAWKDANRDPAAEMAIALMFARWVADAAYRQMTCGNGLHSFGHGEACHYCGARDE